MDTLAFVLQSIDYKDNHKILYTYTKDGQQSILAYNVKKLKNIVKKDLLVLGSMYLLRK